jgi:hypothetical protein
MDRTGAIRLHKEYENVVCELVVNAGHQMIFDNPDGVVEKILKEGRVDAEEMGEKGIENKNENNPEHSKIKGLANSLKFKLDPIEK